MLFLVRLLTQLSQWPRNFQIFILRTFIMAQLEALKQAAQAVADAAAKVQPAVDALKARQPVEDPAVQAAVDSAATQVKAAADAVEAAVASASA